MTINTKFDIGSRVGWQSPDYHQALSGTVTRIEAQVTGPDQEIWYWVRADQEIKGSDRHYLYEEGLYALNKEEE